MTLRHSMLRRVSCCCAERGWCERLVDVASPDSPLQLRMVLSPGPTPASRLLVQASGALPWVLRLTLVQ